MKSKSVFVAVFCLLAIQFVFANQNDKQDKSKDKRFGSISGQIMIQGKPAEGIEVSLYRLKDNLQDREQVIVTTDKAGRYEFINLPADNYWLRVLTNEYLNASDTYGIFAGIDVPLAIGDSVQGANIALILGGMISGRVSDTEGKPVTGIPVELYSLDGQPVYLESRDSEESSTDSQGKFKISGIAPGQYLVGHGVDMERELGKVREKNDYSSIGNVRSDSYYERSYYPGVQDKTKAKRMEVKSGVEIKDLSISIGRKSRAYSLSGQFIDEEGNPVSDYKFGICRRTQGRGYTSSTRGQTDANGFFFIRGFLSGEYFIYEGIGEGKLQVPDTDFEIKDEDLSNVYVKARRGNYVNGSVVLEGTTKSDVLAMIPQLELVAHTSYDWSNRSSSQSKKAQVNDNGTFTIEGLRSGNFEIYISSFSVGRYFAIARIEYPNPDDKQHSEIILPENRREISFPLKYRNLTEVKIFVRYKNGMIKCQVNFVNGQRPQGIPLYAWVTAKGGGGSMPRLNGEGNFVTDGLDDGEYTVEIGNGATRFTEAKTVKITANTVAEVTFDLDVRKIK